MLYVFYANGRPSCWIIQLPLSVYHCSPAQPGVQAWKARISIRSYSEASVSVKTRPPHLTEDEISKLVELASDESTSLSSLTPQLCYACHTTLTSRSSRGTAAPLGPGATTSNVPLPMWVQSTIISDIQIERNITMDDKSGNKKMSRDAMKAEIKEFLLSED